jgi:soluble cytochrome b562
MLSLRSGLIVTSALAAALALGTVALRAQQSPAKPADPQNAPKPAEGTKPEGQHHGPPGGAPAPGQEKSLKDVMNGLKGNLKTLAASVAAKAKDPSVAAVSEMERLVLVAKTFEPQNMADTPEADRPQHLIDFRKDMLGLLKQLADLETEVLDGKFDDATKRIEGPLMDLRDESHDKYKKQHGPGGKGGKGGDGGPGGH